jgi:hypothetical protein
MVIGVAIFWSRGLLLCPVRAGGEWYRVMYCMKMNIFDFINVFRADL